MNSQPREVLRTAGPDAIWGQYNNYRSNGVAMSAVIHIALIGLILAGATFGHQVVQTVSPREIVTLIAPSPDSYALPVAKKVVSGGGGGGDHDTLQAPKGRLPKLAMQQITPPQIVLRNDHPKLAVEPKVVVPPRFAWLKTVCSTWGILRPYQCLQRPRLTELAPVAESELGRGAVLA